MAKGKKTTIKDIKLLKNDIVLINDKEYVLLEKAENVLDAKTMKISSNGNRILRFDDANKKVRIDVKRDINIVKYSISNLDRAKKFKKTHDKNFLKDTDRKEVLAQTISYTKAKEIIEKYSNKSSDTYDKNINVSTFYLSEEIK
ncbi:MAG: hypothetical protein HRT40_13530 [Campylobacteraceae bacterium]|nr:hypothetical protein [Campylobacteraceae bacterium]